LSNQPTDDGLGGFEDWEPSDPKAPPAEAASEVRQKAAPDNVRFGKFESTPKLQPTRLKPLDGLEYLSRVALVGRDAILARAAAPVAYIWQDIAVASTIVLLAGGPGEGKTTLLFLLLAARMNEGEPVSVLGRRVSPAPHGKYVVLIEGEHGEGSTARKLVNSCKLLGLNDIALQRVIIVARKAVRIGSPEWQDVQRMVAAGIVSDIALDTIARVAPTDTDANAEHEQIAIFDRVAQTIDAAPTEEDKPTVWGAAHTRKVDGQPQLNDVSGSTQRVGQADSVLLVKGSRIDGRIVSSCVTFAKLREDPDDFPMPVIFRIVKDETGKRHLLLGEDEVVSNTEEPLETRILSMLAGGPKTKTAMAEVLKRNRGDIETAISNLFLQKRIVSAEITLGGRIRKAFSIRLTHDAKQQDLTQRAAPSEHRTNRNDADA
jgi:hypothetical protein